MKIISLNVFRGRNIYSHKKCIRLNVDLEGYSEIPSKSIDNFNETLVRMLPELTKHRCGINEDMGFLRRLTEGTYLTNITEHIIIALHNMIGVDVCYGMAREISGENYYVIYQYEYSGIAIEVAKLAVDIINSLVNKEHFDLNLRLKVLKDILISEKKEAYTLFKDRPRSIPLVAVTGTNGKTTTTRLIAHILSIAGYTVGMTTTSGIYINGKCIFEGDTTGPKSARTVLENKNIDAAVLETARGGIIREGLAYDLADVGVITNITEDHLGTDGVETMEDLAKVKALVGEAVKDDGYVVINGDNNMSISILHRLKSNIIIFSKDSNNNAMQSNIEKGGYGIYLEDGHIVIQNSINYEKLIDINSIGITMKGILKYNIENAMAACAAAVGLGIDYNIIRQGLMTFYSNYDQNPGRFNIYYVNSIMVILDYGHNIDGYKCVLDGLSHIKHNKLIGVIGVPGDRTDSHILEVGKCAGENLDYIFIREDEDRRGRDIGVVANILGKGVMKSKFNLMNVEKILDEEEAFKTALDFAQPEDIVIIFFDKHEQLIEIIRNKIEESKIETKLVVKI